LKDCHQKEIDIGYPSELLEEAEWQEREGRVLGSPDVIRFELHAYVASVIVKVECSHFRTFPGIHAVLTDFTHVHMSVIRLHQFSCRIKDVSVHLSLRRKLKLWTIVIFDTLGWSLSLRTH